MLPIGWIYIYITYHLLREPETAIEMFRASKGACRNLLQRYMAKMNLQVTLLDFQLVFYLYSAKITWQPLQNPPNVDGIYQEQWRIFYGYVIPKGSKSLPTSVASKWQQIQRARWISAPCFVPLMRQPRTKTYVPLNPSWLMTGSPHHWVVQSPIHPKQCFFWLTSWPLLMYAVYTGDQKRPRKI